MNIIDISCDLSAVRGFVIVIDVLRAFTTACYFFNNGARRIYAVGDLGHARILRKQHADWILSGECNGLKPPDFDYGNSPSEIQHVNFEGQTVVLTTSYGTQAVKTLTNADEIVTGAFANAKALVNYIRKNKLQEVHFLCTDNRWNDNEDFTCASYIGNELNGLKTDFTQIKKRIASHPTSEGFLRKPLTAYSVEDFHLSLEPNRFNFVIKAHKDANGVHFKKIDVSP